VCLITGDKATTELEALGSGVLRIPSESPPPGEEVPVGTVLAYLVGPHEALRSRIVATPRARRAASAHGVDWHTVRGTGRGGRILERDILQAATNTPMPGAPSAASAGQPLTGIRRVTAERLTASAAQVVPVTLTTDADATTLVDLRVRATQDSEPAPTFTDLLIKITATALGDHAALNAQHEYVHIGIAVDTPQGLIVPVVRDAHQRSVDSIARETARLIEAARIGRSRPEDLSDPTFTITNLGMYDIDAFTPVITLPQTAVLGVGRIVARPVVVDDAVVVRRMLALSLTFDHRLVDGAPAARFLQAVAAAVENPSAWLLS